MAEKIKSEFGQVDLADGYDLGEYRFAVAKVARCLIRARLICDPKFSRILDRSTWSIPSAEPQDPTMSKAEIAEGQLKQAKAANEHLWRNFIGPNGSGGVSLRDRLQSLKAMVNYFVKEFELDKAITQLRNGKKVEWEKLATWDKLTRIRGWLDRLPAPKDPGDCPVVIVDATTRRRLVNGKEEILTQSRFNVIQCLLKDYPRTLTKDALVKMSGHPGAVGIVKRLRNKNGRNRSSAGVLAAHY